MYIVFQYWKSLSETVYNLEKHLENFWNIGTKLENYFLNYDAKLVNYYWNDGTKLENYFQNNGAKLERWCKTGNYIQKIRIRILSEN